MSKESHSFPVYVAERIGVIEAIVFQHMVFLQKEVGCDGWVKRSRQALTETYSYLTEKQVRGAIDRIEQAGYIVATIENPNKFDRTKSYQVTESGYELMGISPLAKRANAYLQKGQSEVPKRANAISYNSYNSSSSYDAGENQIFDVQEEIKKMAEDATVEETFCLVRKIPRGHFKEYVNLFAIEVKGTKEKYFTTKDITKHFLNWSTIRHRIESKPKAENPTPGPARKSVHNHFGGDASKYNEASAHW